MSTLMGTLQADVMAQQRELIATQARRIAAQQDIIGSQERTFRLLLDLADMGADVREHLARIVADADAVKV